MQSLQLLVRRKPGILARKSTKIKGNKIQNYSEES